MSRKCELTNKKPMTGNRVSHAVNRTNRRFLPNLKHVKLMSRVLKKEFSFKIATHTLRTIDFKGGLDQYLINTHHRFLTKKARTIKKEILLRTKINNT